MYTPFCYITSVRFPSEKAHALYVAKTMDAFARRGHTATIVAPRRTSRMTGTVSELYGVTGDVTVTLLPAIDLFELPVPRIVAHYVCLATFLVSVAWYVRRHISRETTVFTNDTSIMFALPRHLRSVLEVHDYLGRFRSLARRALARATFVLSNNEWKVEKLRHDFSLPEHKVFAAHNGVDWESFAHAPERLAARRKLHIPDAARVVLYAGHLYDWKGASVLAQAAHELELESVLFYFVGGTPEDLARFSREYGTENVHLVGHRPHGEMPLWMHAADILVLPNTARAQISLRYTSPMKLFEYMASGTPIVASDIPSIREVLHDGEAYFVSPDNPHALAQGIMKALEDPVAREKGARAQRTARDYTWDARADRVLKVLAIEVA